MKSRKAKKSPELKKLEATKTLLVKVEDGGDSGNPEDLFFVAYENTDENDGLAKFENDEVLAVFTFDRFVRVKKETTIVAVELA
jgi:hypothetical protein